MQNIIDLKNDLTKLNAFKHVQAIKHQRKEIIEKGEIVITSKVPVEATQIEEQIIEYSPEVHYQFQTYQTPINPSETKQQDSIISESIQKLGNVTFSNGTNKTNPSPLQHFQMISDIVGPNGTSNRILSPTRELNYDINTYNTITTPINPQVVQQNIINQTPLRTGKPPLIKKRLNGSKSSNNFFSDKHELLFNNNISQNGFLNITESQTYEMGKPKNYENDAMMNKSRVINPKNKMSEYIIANNKHKYRKNKKDNHHSKKSKSVNSASTPLTQRSKGTFSYNNIKYINQNDLKRKNRKIGFIMNLLQKKTSDKDVELEITRGMRDEKGGVVDFAYTKNNEKSGNTSQIVRYGKNTLCINNKRVIDSAKIIQKWWKNILAIYNNYIMKVTKIQSWFRGWYYRSLLNAKKPQRNIMILKETENKQTDKIERPTIQPLICSEPQNVVEIIQPNNNNDVNGALLIKNILMKPLYRLFNELIRKGDAIGDRNDLINRGVDTLVDVLRKKVIRDKFMTNPLTWKLRQKYLHSILTKSNDEENDDNLIKDAFKTWRINALRHLLKKPNPLEISHKENKYSYEPEEKRPKKNIITFEDAFSLLHRTKPEFSLDMSDEMQIQIPKSKPSTFKNTIPSKEEELNYIRPQKATPQIINEHNLSVLPKQKLQNQLAYPIEFKLPAIRQFKNKFIDDDNQISQGNMNIPASYEKVEQLPPREVIIEKEVIKEIEIEPPKDYGRLKYAIIHNDDKNKKHALKSSLNKLKTKPLKTISSVQTETALNQPQHNISIDLPRTKTQPINALKLRNLKTAITNPYNKTTFDSLLQNIPPKKETTPQLEEKEKEQQQQQTQAQIEIQPPKDNILKKRKQLLSRRITSNDLKNKLLLYLAFLKWYRKALALQNKKHVNIRKKIPIELQRLFYHNLLRFPFEQIKKEARRRKIIKLFYHIRNLKYPILYYVFKKIKKYAHIKYQIMNAFATIIQRYYRLKYRSLELRKNNKYLIEENETTVKKTTQVIIEETFPQRGMIQYHEENINGNMDRSGNNFQYIKYENRNYRNIGELFREFYRKLTVKRIIEALYYNTL